MVAKALQSSSTSLPRDDIGRVKLLPFAFLMKTGGFNWPLDDEKVTVPSAFLTHLLKLVCRYVPLNEPFYLQKHPDVAEAITQGRFQSAKHHYEAFGFFEGRQPYAIAVDNDYYLDRNADVRDSIKEGLVASAQSHFERHGWREGRLPSENFDLLQSAV